ncbi:MAG: beta-ketoacyl-ACP synthase III [Chitinophagales bacterium]
MPKTLAAITGVAGYVPDDILSNADLEKLVDTNDEWIVTRTGIKERRILKEEGKGSAYLGTKAVELLLKKTNTDPKEVDAIICATVTPSHLFPSNANIIAYENGMGHIMSFDVSAACSGFIYALTTGVRLIESGAHKKVIVVGADKMTSIVNYQDRTTCVLFGDGAGAVLLEASADDCGVQDAILKSNGIGKDYLIQKAGGSAYPASAETVANRQHFLHQEGKSVFRFAVKGMADVAEEIMVKNNLTGEDVAWLVPHQANKRIIDATAKRMGVSMDKVMVNIQKYGNTTAATIPLCLWDWESQLNKGDNIILAAFGGGFTWGSVYIKWAYDSKD